MSDRLILTGQERTFDENELIVSKTDLKGRMTYVNDVFLRVAGYAEGECLGQPHNIIRHPHMPRCIFKLLWDAIQGGREIFAYVLNRAANGDHYWVIAHVTPTVDMTGTIIGYHSNRRAPERRLLNGHVIPLYDFLLAEEQRHANAREGLAASVAAVERLLKDSAVTYDEFIAKLV